MTTNIQCTSESKVACWQMLYCEQCHAAKLKRKTQPWQDSN
uniref:Uncharacterized protein n=1 Tax=Arundo donax TaxID=35708 RepID=A0A0A9BL56_ARUDO